MYKKLAILFGVVAFCILMVGAVLAYDWISSRAENPDDPQGRSGTITVEWGHTQGDVPNFGFSYEGEVPYSSEDTTLELPLNGGNSTAADLPDDEYNETAPERPPNEITPDNLAPDFTMYDAYGNEVRLSDFFGKPIILNFWTTWCPSCVREIPYFQQLYTEAGDDVHILKVNLLDGQRETRERVDNFMVDNNLTFPLFFDAGAGAIEYGVMFIPMTFFIDANGALVSSIQGAVNANTLQSGLDEISR